MVDGTRPRRYSSNVAKRRWYARHRAARFAERFGALPRQDAAIRPLLLVAGALESFAVSDSEVGAASGVLAWKQWSDADAWRGEEVAVA